MGWGAFEGKWVRKGVEVVIAREATCVREREAIFVLGYFILF